MALITLAEYVEIDGVPLATPAWTVTSLHELYDVPAPLGEFVEVPYRRGGLAARRQSGVKRVALPMVIYGDKDQDNVAHPDVRTGLMLNRDTLVRDVVRPLQINTSGLRTLTHHTPDGSTRSGPCQVIGTMRFQPLGRAGLSGMLEVGLTDGGLRATTQVDVTSASVPASGSDTLIVPNPGTDYQDAIIYTLTGTATSVKVYNDTADPTNAEVWFEFGGDLTGGVVIDTLLYTTVRNSVNVVGLMNHSGHERWCPLVPGNNTLRIEPLGGTATLQAQHYPFYA